MSSSTSTKLVISDPGIHVAYWKILGCYPGFSFSLDELFVDILGQLHGGGDYNYVEYVLNRTLQRASIENADPFDVDYMRSSLAELYQVIVQAVEIRRSYDPPGLPRPWFYHGTLGTDFVIGTDDLSLTDIPGD